MISNIIKKSLNYSLLALLLVGLSQSTFAQAPAGHICKPHTGPAPEEHGSGDCAGNNFRTYDLSYVYGEDGGLKLFYNSLFGDHNVLDLGKRITSSNVAFVDINSANPYFWSGDGSHVYLKLQNSGPYANAYLAKNRNLLSDYFKKEGTLIKQYSMDGAVYTYSPVGANSPTRYILTTSCSSLGTCKNINISIKPEGTREGVKVVSAPGQITLTNSLDSKRWVKLIKDGAGRLILIEYADKTKYQLAYVGSTSILASETLIAPDGKSEATSFIYDKENRLINVISNGISKRIIRNISGRYTETLFPSGQTQKIIYDGNGHARSITNYLLAPEKKKVVLEAVEKVFDANGVLKSTRYAEGASNIEIQGQFNANGVPLGYKKLKNGKLVEEFIQTTNPVSWLSTSDTLKDGVGKVLSKTTYVYPNSWPYKIASIKYPDGRSESYTYNKSDVNITKFNAGGTKESLQSFQGGLLSKVTDYLAPTAFQVRTYKYDAKERVISETLGDSRKDYRYNANGQVEYFRDEESIEHEFGYDAEGNISRQVDKFAGGNVVTTFLRTFYSGTQKKLKAVKESITYPSKEVEVKDTFYGENGKVQKVVKNGVVVWEG